MGDVLTIRKSLALYRVHDASYSGMRSLDAFKLRGRLHQDVEKARLFTSVSLQLGLSIPPDPLRYSLNHLQYRLASYLVERSAHPFPDDRMVGLVYRLLFSAAATPQMRLRDRAILMAWTIACVLSPPGFRRNFILWRFAAISRPQTIRALLGALSSLRSPRLPDRA
jgi:hypothetical protein